MSMSILNQGRKAFNATNQREQQVHSTHLDTVCPHTNAEIGRRKTVRHYIKQKHKQLLEKFFDIQELGQPIVVVRHKERG